MLFYVFFLLCIAFLCGRYNIAPGHYIIHKRAGYVLAVVFIIVVTSLRFNIGFDWNSYLRFIYPNFHPRRGLSLNEPLAWLIINTAGYLGNPLFMYSVFAIITYANVGRVIAKYSVSKYESLIIYISILWLSDLSIIRQAAAVSFAFYGFTYIEQKKPFKYFLICIVAFCFHKSGVIALLLYPLYWLKPIFLPFILVALFIALKFALPMFLAATGFYSMDYLNADMTGGRFQRFFLVILILYALAFHQKDRRAIGLINICAIGAVMPFILPHHAGGRVANYFSVYFSLLIPECNKRFNINYRVLFMIPFYAYFFIYLITTVVGAKSTDYVPWRWYFLEDLDSAL